MKIIKKIIFVFFITTSIMAQKKTMNEENNSVKFVIKNIGINVNGSFSDIKSDIKLDYKNLASSVINILIASNSINTDNKARDKHLKQEDYFDVEKHPTIEFKSQKIQATSRLNRFIVQGLLTIKGISKQLDVEITTTEKNNLLEIKSNLEINRRNYKVGGNSLVLSDIVKMNIILNTSK